MAGNPNPQHNPTDGLGVAAQITLSGGANGSAVQTIVAGREYAVLLSLSSATVVQQNLPPLAPGVNYPAGVAAANVAVTAALKDIKSNAYSAVGTAVTAASRNTAVATVSVTNFVVTVTSVKKGVAEIDIYFPTFDNTESGTDGVTLPGSGDQIHVRLTVVVVA